MTMLKPAEFNPKTYAEFVAIWRGLQGECASDILTGRLFEIRCMRAYPDFDLECEDQDELDFYRFAAFKYFDLQSFVKGMGRGVQIIGEAIAHGAKRVTEYPPPPRLTWWRRLLRWIGWMKKGRMMTVWNFYNIDPTKVLIKKGVLTGKKRYFFIQKDVNHAVEMPSDRVSAIQRLAGADELRGSPPYNWVLALKLRQLRDAGMDETHFDFRSMIVDIDDPASPNWEFSRQADRQAMEDWMIFNFFQPLKEANGLKNLPVIRWRKESWPPIDYIKKEQERWINQGGQ